MCLIVYCFSHHQQNEKLSFRSGLDSVIVTKSCIIFFNIMELHKVNELKKGLRSILVLAMWQKSEIISLDSPSPEQFAEQTIFLFFLKYFFSHKL